MLTIKSANGSRNFALPEPIIVRQWPDEETRTAERSCCWIAETPIGGRGHTARSRYGAPNELARQLVAAGIPDAPMQVFTAGVAGHMTWRSFHHAASRTTVEGISGPVYLARYRSPEDRLQYLHNRPKHGVIALPGTGVAPAPSARPERVAAFARRAAQ